MQVYVSTHYFNLDAHMFTDSYLEFLFDFGEGPSSCQWRYLLSTTFFFFFSSYLGALHNN